MNPPIIDAALIIGHRYQMGRRTWHLCVVPGCSDTHSTRHQFPNPDKDRKRFDVWLQLVQNPNLLELDPKQVFTNYSVCPRTCSWYGQQYLYTIYHLPQVLLLHSMSRCRAVILSRCLFLSSS